MQYSCKVVILILTPCLALKIHVTHRDLGEFVEHEWKEAPLSAELLQSLFEDAEEDQGVDEGKQEGQVPPSEEIEEAPPDIVPLPVQKIREAAQYSPPRWEKLQLADSSEENSIEDSVASYTALSVEEGIEAGVAWRRQQDFLDQMAIWAGIDSVGKEHLQCCWSAVADLKSTSKKTTFDFVLSPNLTLHGLPSVGCEFNDQSPNKAIFFYTSSTIQRHMALRLEMAALPTPRPTYAPTTTTTQSPQSIKTATSKPRTIPVGPTGTTSDSRETAGDPLDLTNAPTPPPTMAPTPPPTKSPVPTAAPPTPSPKTKNPTQSPTPGPTPEPTTILQAEFPKAGGGWTTQEMLLHLKDDEYPVIKKSTFRKPDVDGKCGFAAAKKDAELAAANAAASAALAAANAAGSAELKMNLMASRQRGVDDEDPVSGRKGDVVDPVSGARFDYWKGPKWQFQGCYRWDQGNRHSNPGNNGWASILPEQDRYYLNNVQSIGQCYDWAVQRRCLIWSIRKHGDCAAGWCAVQKDASQPTPYYDSTDYYGLQEGDDWKNRYETQSLSALNLATERGQAPDDQCLEATWGGMNNQKGIWGGKDWSSGVYLRVSSPADTFEETGTNIKYWDLEESFFDIAGTQGQWTVATNYTHCSWVKWGLGAKEFHTLWYGSTSGYGSMNSAFLNSRRRGVKSYGLGVPLVPGSSNSFWKNPYVNKWSATTGNLQFLDPTDTLKGIESRQTHRRRARVHREKWNFVCTVGYKTSTGSDKSIFYMNMYPDGNHGEEDLDPLVDFYVKNECKFRLVQSLGLCGGTPAVNNFQDNTNLNDNIDYCRDFCAGSANVGVGGYFAYTNRYNRCICYSKSEGCPQGVFGKVKEPTGKGLAQDYNTYEILAERDPNAPNVFGEFGGLFPIKEWDRAMIEPGAKVMRIGNAEQEPGKLAMYKSWNRALSYEELRDEFAKTAVDITV